MPNPIMQYFVFEHLPPNLQEISGRCGELAAKMDEILPDGEEKTVGLRKLLEAKDCFVRARLGRAETPPDRVFIPAAGVIPSAKR